MSDVDTFSRGGWSLLLLTPLSRGAWRWEDDEAQDCTIFKAEEAAEQNGQLRLSVGPFKVAHSKDRWSKLIGELTWWPHMV